MPFWSTPPNLDPTSTPTTASTTTPTAPDRTTRQKCYDARDTFFACLEQHGIVDSIKEGGKAEQLCGGQERGLRENCAGSWVTYFKQRRVMEYNKQQTLNKLLSEGAKPMEDVVVNSGSGGKS